MVQIIERNDIFGKIGKGLGQGLSDQLPKEVDRTRLVKGLENLRNQPQGMNPFDVAVQIFGIPGLKPDVAATLLPLFQTELTRSRGLQEAGDASAPQMPGMGGSAGQGQPQPGQVPTGEAPQQQSENFPRYGVMENITSPYYTPEQKRSLADTKFKKNPGLYRTPEEARAAVDLEEGFNVKRYNDIKSQTAEKLQEYLQKEGSTIYEDIPAEYLDKFVQKAYSDAKNRDVSIDSISRGAAQEALKLARSRQDMSNIDLLDKLKRGNQKSLTDLLPAYKKYGADELWIHDVGKTHGVSDMKARSMAYPPSASLQKAISPYSTDRESLKYAVTPIETQSRDIKSIMKALTDEDSLSALLLNLKKRGFNENNFIDTVRSLKAEGKIKLNPIQQKELDNLVPYGRGSLPDYMIDAF